MLIRFPQGPASFGPMAPWKAMGEETNRALLHAPPTMQDSTVYRAHPAAPGQERGILSTSAGKQTRKVPGLAHNRWGPE